MATQLEDSLNALGTTAAAVILGSVGASALLAAWRFPNGFGTGVWRQAAAGLGAVALLTSLPLLAGTDGSGHGDPVSPGEGFERALRRLPVALADLEQPKAYSYDVGLQPIELESTMTVDGIYLSTTAMWKGKVTDPRKPLVMYELGGGVSERTPRVTAIVTSAQSEAPARVTLSGERLTTTEGGDLRTWLATVEPLTTLRVDDLVTVKIVEELATEEIASAFWFDPRDYPESLADVTMCAEQVVGAFPFLWTNGRIRQLHLGTPRAGAEAFEEPSGIRREGGRICVREGGATARLEPFVVLFLQSADQRTASTILAIK